MAYNYTKASDLAKWCVEQYNKPTEYVNGGIGRYNGTIRLFDCVGLIKCFMWHDYSQYNARYYGDTCPDWNCEMFYAAAKEKGSINTIPEIPGIIVYQRGHVGVYMGNGLVIEATAAFGGKVVKSYFKGNHKGINYRGTWTHWFKMPQLKYEAPVVQKPQEPTSTGLKFKVGDKVIVNGNLYMNSNAASPTGFVENRLTKITRVAKGAAHPYNTTGDLGWMNESSIKLANSKKSIDEIAREVINGTCSDSRWSTWGNGATRKERLTAAGYSYSAVQARVNELLS